jgi:hypothetical protein
MVAVDERLRSGDLRKQVRLAWCLAGGGPEADAKCAKDFGISQTCVQVWRDGKEPDGQDWEQFRVQLSLAGHDAQIAMLAATDEVAVHAEIIRGAQRILGGLSASLNEGVLYDGPPPKNGKKDTRNVVDHLWSQDGAVVPVGPLRAKSATEAVRMYAGLSATLDGSYRRVEQLLEMRANKQKVEDDVFMLCHGTVRELWGEEGAKRFWDAVIAKGEEAKGEADGERPRTVQFEAEDIEDEDDDGDGLEDYDDDED